MGSSLPNSNICEFLWCNSNALGCRGNNTVSKPCLPLHSESVFYHLKWIGQAVLSDNMSFEMCDVFASAIPICMNQNK